MQIYASRGACDILRGGELTHPVKQAAVLCSQGSTNKITVRKYSGKVLLFVEGEISLDKTRANSKSRYRTKLAKEGAKKISSCVFIYSFSC